MTRNKLGRNGYDLQYVNAFFDDIENAEKMRLDGMSHQRIADYYKVSKGFVQRHLKHLTEETTETRIKALLENERIKLLTMRW